MTSVSRLIDRIAPLPLLISAREAASPLRRAMRSSRRRRRSSTSACSARSRPPKANTYACFVRRYDADHLARHPHQKVTSMKLLVTSEWFEGNTTLERHFRLGVTFRNKRGTYDSSGSCSHFRPEDAKDEIRFGCGVDCDGGGINIAMGKDDKSVLVRLSRVRIWQNNKPDEEAGDELVAGKDDAIFRLDRASSRNAGRWSPTARSWLRCVRSAIASDVADRRATHEGGHHAPAQSVSGGLRIARRGLRDRRGDEGAGGDARQEQGRLSPERAPTRSSSSSATSRTISRASADRTR